MNKSSKGIKRVKLLFLSILALIIFQVLNFSSNLFLLLSQEGDLLVEESQGWRKLNSSSKAFSLKTEFESHSFTVQHLSFIRNHPGIFGRTISKLFPGKIKIIEITPENEFIIIADPGSAFRSMNSSEALEWSSSNFVLNANFYGTKQQIMGELILEGQTYKDQSNASGFFRVINNTPYVGPRSYINSIAGEIQYSCQAFPSVINQGQIFPYILTEKQPSNSQWKKKTYRNLVGRKKNGNIVFILSNQRGFLSVKEITIIAMLYDLDTAALFDGGRALQYSLDHPDYKLSFAAFNNKISLGRKVDEFFLRKKSMTFVQKSPVYIGVKLP